MHQQMFYKFIKLFLILGLLTGCSVKVLTPQKRTENIQHLSQMLLNTSNLIDKGEALDLAKSSVEYAEILAKKYELVSPPLLQNTLVNIGIKERGLCYEWSNDLLAYLLDKEYRSFQFHHVGSNIGSYFEHNALAVSAKGLGVEQSIVLDAWRDSGKLYFIEINRDKKYDWKKRSDL